MALTTSTPSHSTQSPAHLWHFVWFTVFLAAFDFTGLAWDVDVWSEGHRWKVATVFALCAILFLIYHFKSSRKLEEDTATYEAGLRLEIQTAKAEASQATQDLSKQASIASQAAETAARELNAKADQASKAAALAAAALTAQADKASAAAALAAAALTAQGDKASAAAALAAAALTAQGDKASATLNNMEGTLLGEIATLRSELKTAQSKTAAANLNLGQLSANPTLNAVLRTDLESFVKTEMAKKFRTGGFAWELEIFKPVTGKNWDNRESWYNNNEVDNQPLVSFSRGGGEDEHVQSGCFRTFCKDFEGAYCILLFTKKCVTGFEMRDPRLMEVVEQLNQRFGPLIQELIKAGLKGTSSKIQFTAPAAKTASPAPPASPPHEREWLFLVTLTP